MNARQFEQMVDVHSGFVYNIAYRMMGNPEDAEEVVQDAFMSAYRARERFRGDAQIRTWLYRITVNAALMRIRRDKRRSQAIVPGPEPAELEIPDWEQLPDKAALNKELGEEIGEAIAALPPDLNVAVVLRDVQGLSNEEAADVLEISLSAFKARLHRGRLALRRALAEYVRRREGPPAV